jgi:hypothetical protein
MDKHEDTHESQPPSENADLEYILDLFNNEELSLTIAEDTEENERSSKITHKKSGDSIDMREEISDAKYRFAFLSFFRKYREVAVSFIDTAIRFMNGIKKLKMEDLVRQLSEEEVMPKIIDSLICPELLVEPIEDELAYRDLSEADVKRYEQALLLLKSSKELSGAAKSKIQLLLSQIESH